MTRTALLKRLDSMLATAESERMWGNFEIEIRDGQPTVLRKQTSERLQERDITHDRPFNR